MIIREWRCRARQSEAAKYPDYFRSEVIPELRNVQGFAGGFLSQRQSGEYVEYLSATMTFWKSFRRRKRSASSWFRPTGRCHRWMDPTP
jgi:hypothetical protein